ncbi:MAG: hypothetical protein K2L16_06740 [Muribaculaceae bacterium]|nr:hypothetical protein [Muribaculaceae bacterium]
MKFKNYLAVAMLALPASVFAQDSGERALYVLPVNADGTISSVDGDYPDKIAMTQASDGSMTATGVEISKGFLFYGIGDSGSTLYKLASWAQQDVVENLPNPLAITASEDYISLPAGIYDISFFTRNITGYTYQLFTVQSRDRAHRYPDKIYLIWGTGAGNSQELTGTDGVYTGVLGTQASFSVSYEPRTGSGVFVYGPEDASATVLEESIPAALEYGVNTSALFSYDAIDRASTEVTVSLVDGDSYIRIGPDSGDVTSVPVLGIERPEEVEYYSLTGARVAVGPAGTTPRLNPGIYIVHQGNSVRKQLFF